MAKFILSPEVEEELTAIAEYIAEDDPDTADRVTAQVVYAATT